MMANMGSFREELMNKAAGGQQYIDLHLHTTNSDGEESPDMVVKKAKDAGVSLMAITDHNFFTDTAPREYEGMSIVPGIELSAEYGVPSWNESAEIHIVGVFPDGVNAADFDWILSDIEGGKLDYVAAILQGLGARGIDISMKEVMSVERAHKHIGRHEVARVLVDKGIEDSIDAAFDHQIGNFSPFYIPSTRYIQYAALNDVVCQVVESGGIPILAHPYGYSMNVAEMERLVMDFTRAAACAAGKKTGTPEPVIAGMEVYYQMYVDSEDRSQIDFLKNMQEKYHLLASAGSDRHRSDQAFCTAGNRELFIKMLRRLRGAE